MSIHIPRVPTRDEVLNASNKPLPASLRTIFLVLTILGALVFVIGAFVAAPLVTIYTEDRGGVDWSALALAMARARNLWSVLFVGVMFVYLLYRRRTPRAMPMPWSR